MESAERSLEEGEYTKAARKCAETYLLLLDKRPDLIPPPGMGLGPHGGPSLGRLAAGSESRADQAAAFGVGRMMRRAFWPPQGGIRVIVDEDHKPSLTYEKDRFSLSEAATYFEFMVEQLVMAQREPPAS